MQTELNALQNAANYFKDAVVVQYFENDKRIKANKYYLTISTGGAFKGISPVLTYEKLNHFILGMIRQSEFKLEVKS